MAFNHLSLPVARASVENSGGVDVGGAHQRSPLAPSTETSACSSGVLDAPAHNAETENANPASHG